MKKILIILMLLMMVACSSGDATVENTPSATPEASQVVVVETQEVEEGDPSINPLTGLPGLPEEAWGKRPVAVMVNNIMAAMPQLGIGEADVIFEVPVEGGLTRLLAIFPDYINMPKVCSVRSYRYYFPPLALGFDAYYVHWGEDESMMDYYFSLDMDSFDGLNGGVLFGRDQSRRAAGYALEHTSYFDGTAFADYLESNKIRTDLAEEYQGTAFNFVEGYDLVQPDGEDCTYVYLNFGNQLADLTYNEEDGLYYKTINGSKQIDGNTGEQLAFTNVIVLPTTIWSRGDDKGHIGLDWYGPNTGYYISNGKVQEMAWKKEKEYTQIQMQDTSGNDLLINRGKTYIAYVDFGSYSFK